MRIPDGEQFLAVLGSPIAHSKSPAIHEAAYRELGLPWDYSAIEVASGELASFLDESGSRWRGLSLTMPLKREILPMLSARDEVTDRVGAANTVLFEDGRLRGFNTDVYGVKRMLQESFAGTIDHAHLLGGGATACSVAVALAELGVRELTVGTRSPERAVELVSVARGAGLRVKVGELGTDPGAPELVVSTLPGTVILSEPLPEGLCASAPLVDIAYDPEPTAIARLWHEQGGVVLGNGLRMLVHQALAQVRIFVAGDPALALPNEGAVLAAMRVAAFGTS